MDWDIALSTPFTGYQWLDPEVEKKGSYKKHNLQWDIKVVSKNDIFSALSHIYYMFYSDLDLAGVANPKAFELVFHFM